MTDLPYLSVADAARLLRTKELSPVEYARALIARIEKYAPKLNTFIRITPEISLDDARRAEAEIARGEWRGNLDFFVPAVAISNLKGQVHNRR
jgi:aspartyl-tRNA(Asn)/glutamyl-tRNA(Gln) amidotransferase subunit A